MEINTREVIGFLYGLKRELCDGCTLEQGHLIQDTMKYAIDCIIKYQQMQSDYENRLKADLKAILVELQLEIEEMSGLCTEIHGDEWNEINTVHSQDVLSLIQQKINALKAESEDA